MKPDSAGLWLMVVLGIFEVFVLLHSMGLFLNTSMELKFRVYVISAMYAPLLDCIHRREL